MNPQTFWLTWYAFFAIFLLGWYVMISDEVLRNFGIAMARVAATEIDFAQLAEHDRQLNIILDAFGVTLARLTAASGREKRPSVGNTLSHKGESNARDSSTRT